MSAPKIISPEFLLWSQTLLVWSLAAYGVTDDPLRAEGRRSSRRRWIVVLVLRSLFGAAIIYGLSASIALACAWLVAVVSQALLRSRCVLRLLAEFESLWVITFAIANLAVIRELQLSTRWVPDTMSSAHLSAVCIFASVVMVVVRGGTYIVRGVLKKSGALPIKRVHDSQPLSTPEDSSPATSIAASVEQLIPSIDVDEYNRGRLIGSLERIVLVIVVAGGSYAALAFLVAAKGIVRSDEFGKNRDFAEYFLVGSLCSILVALSAGIALRFTLMRLWPDLLSLQMQ